VFSAETRRRAAAFDAIGERYDDVFPQVRPDHRHPVDDQTARLKGSVMISAAAPGCRPPACSPRRRRGRRRIDVSTEILALARRSLPTGQFVAMDVMELDGSLGQFDEACAFFPADTAPVRHPEVLRRVRSVLRPGGLVTIRMVEAPDYAPLTASASRCPCQRTRGPTWSAAADRLHVLEVDVGGSGGVWRRCRRSGRYSSTARRRYGSVVVVSRGAVTIEGVHPADNEASASPTAAPRCRRGRPTGPARAAGPPRFRPLRRRGG
jgi:hypothetical protein